MNSETTPLFVRNWNTIGQHQDTIWAVYNESALTGGYSIRGGHHFLTEHVKLLERPGNYVIRAGICFGTLHLMANDKRTMNVAATAIRVSEQFCSEDADLTFQSSDGVVFRIHSKDLNFASGGFPPFLKEKRNDVVFLTEKASTLELLFLFVYPQRHPNLASTPIADLADLAEAAEKYNVFPAVSICNIHMRNNLTLSQQNIPFVLEYATNHRYHDLADKAAKILLDSYSPGQLMVNTPAPILVAWMRYSDHWHMARAKIADLIKSDYLAWGIGGLRRRFGTCASCPKTLDALFFPVLVELAQSTTAVKDLGAFFKKPQCDHEENVMDEVISKANDLAREIPNFSTFW